MTQPDMIHYPAAQASAGFDRAAPPQLARRAGVMVRISAVLASWRATERELNELSEGSPDWPRLRAVVESLRVTHHRLFVERRDDSSGP